MIPHAYVPLWILDVLESGLVIGLLPVEQKVVDQSRASDPGLGFQLDGEAVLEAEGRVQVETGRLEF